jgi:hypothetical protein
MSSNLQVKITADIVDLQGKFGIAKAETAALGAEISKLNRLQQAGTFTVLPGVMDKLNKQFVTAKVEAAALGAQLGSTISGLAGVGAAAEHSHGSVSTATREFRALFDELSSGRTHQAPGTIAILLQRVAGLSPAMLGAVGGVLALTGGLAYLGYQANKTSGELNAIDIKANFAGNFDITRAAIQRYADELSHASNVSSSESRKIVAAFAEVPGMTYTALGALTSTISQFAQETGEDALKASEGFAKLLAGDVSAGEFAKKLGAITQLSQAQLDQASAADRSGNASSVLTEKISLLDQVVTAGESGLNRYAAGAAEIAESVAAGESGVDQMQLMISLTGAQTDKINQATEARKRYLAAQPVAASPEATLKTGVSAATSENPIALQVQQAQSKINEMNAALAIARERGDQISIDKLDAGLQKAQENLANLQFGPVFERMREQIQMVAVTWDGTQTGMLAKQIAIAQASLASVQSNSKERVQVENEVVRLQVELRRAASAQIIAAAREQVAEIGALENESALQRAAKEHSIWQAALADTRLTAQGRIEVERDVAQASTQIQRAAAAESAAISRQNAQADIAIARMTVEAQRNALQLSTAASAKEVSARLAQLRELTASEFDMNNQRLEAEMASYAREPAEANRVYNEIRELKAKLVLDLQSLDKQAAEANAKYAREQYKDWKTAVGEIESAEGTFVSDILTKRKSLSQSLLALSAEMVTKEIADDARAVTTRLLLEQSAQTSEKALQQGGFLYHAVVQKLKTSATTAAQSAQTAAVATGQAAQTSALVSGTSAGKAVQAAAGPSQVMADAAEAFAGAYAATAAIPYIGPELAPAAAAEAFAAVASMAGAASLDVGTNYVPRDMPAFLHEGERVTPKAFNPDAGYQGERGNEVQEQHNYGDVHMSALDTRGLATLLKGHGGRQAIVQAARTYFSRGGGRR